MNPDKTERIKRFIVDERMAEAVKEVIQKSFLKTQSKEVNYLAASRIALDLLEDAWKELLRYKEEEGEKSTKVNYV